MFFELVTGASNMSLAGTAWQPSLTTLRSEEQKKLVFLPNLEIWDDYHQRLKKIVWGLMAKSFSHKQQTFNTHAFIALYYRASYSRIG